MSEDVVAWVRSYLEQRTQIVMVGTACSKMRVVGWGIPQGSALGLLLYAIYLNEITEVVKEDDCLDPVHQDNQTLFGRQCQTCGTVTTYMDDATYCMGSRSRMNNTENMKKKILIGCKYFFTRIS